MSRLVYPYGRLLFLVLCCLTLNHVSAQLKVLRGIVKDQHSDERIPFASIHFQKGSGKLADSAGGYTGCSIDRSDRDTLRIVTRVALEMARNDSVRFVRR